MDKENTIHLSDYQALAEFRYQIRRFLRFSEQTARSEGLEPQQYQLLLAVKGMPEEKRVTVGELAERLQLQHHSTVELIDRLSDRGFVQRQRDEEDQRRVLISITPVGEEILQRLAEVSLVELSSSGPSLVQALDALLKNKI
ncbi:MAG: helix-turn-helix domain-containing protein [Ktedonobacteraceae bacterium]